MDNNYLSIFEANDKKYYYIDINNILDVKTFPYSLIALYENYFFQKLPSLESKKTKDLLREAAEVIHFKPHRILMQDYTAIPLLVDWLAFHERTLNEHKHYPTAGLTPNIPIDIIIDHSLQSDYVAAPDAYKLNLQKEYQKNKERFEFLKWVGENFDNINVIPPGNGICHQINLESLSNLLVSKTFNGIPILLGESIIGTDSHTTMINGLSMLGWGVGGLEAESVMLGEPILMDVPKVVNISLRGQLSDNVHITEVALYLAEKLRKMNVVGKFLEFTGKGLDGLPVPHRATLANMTPEYGATCSYFPIDEQTLRFLRQIGKSEEHIACVENYAKLQGLWHRTDERKTYEDIIELDLSTLKTCVAGPKRPQDRLRLDEISPNFTRALENERGTCKSKGTVKNGDIVIASITSCTSTSNPEAIFAAALLAKKACEFGLTIPFHVKTSFAPGSRFVEKYLLQSNLMEYMNQLGFNIIGYGCATCSGNSGSLLPEIEGEIANNNLAVCSILSGNRNFEGRIHRLVKANYLASPPLVIAFSLMGNVLKNLENNIFGTYKGKQILLKDIFPTKKEVFQYMEKYISPKLFLEKKQCDKLSQELWNSLKAAPTNTYEWKENSTYIKKPPFIFQRESKGEVIVDNAQLLLILGNSITTDHISPVGEIPMESPAGEYLLSQNISQADFNSLGSRRGNYEIMIRGAFGNVRIKNEIKGVSPGPFTKFFPENKEMRIFDAATAYLKANIPLVIIAGKEYGAGSSRDWAAKGPYLLGIRCIIAESFERIHRSNLIGMGIFPFILASNYTKDSLSLEGNEQITIRLIEEVKPHALAECIIKTKGKENIIPLNLNINNDYEKTIIEAGGIFNFCFNKLRSKSEFSQIL